MLSNFKMDFKLILICIFIGHICTKDPLVTCYNYTDDKNPYRYFGVRTPYDVVQAEKIEVLGDDCEPVYIWGLLRHPTRYGGDECWNEEKMNELKEKIVKHMINSKHLSLNDKIAIQNWKYTAGQNLDVTPQGLEDVRGIASRFKDAIGKLMGKKALVRENFEIATSSSRRCTTSALAFTNTWLETEYKDYKTAKIDIRDELLKVRDDINKKNSKEKREFENSEYVEDVVRAVSKRLGFPKNDPLTKEEIMQLYYSCANENSWYPKTYPGLCAAFEPEHLKVFEYLEDVLTYYYCGYGANNNESFADELLKDFITKLTDAAKNNAKGKLGTFLFAHNITVVPFLKRFHLFEEDKPLQTCNYKKKKDDRQFRSSKFNNFNSNFVGTLYKCGQQYLVAPYLNENLIQLKMCASEVCTLQELKNYYKTYQATSSTASGMKAGSSRATTSG